MWHKKELGYRKASNLGWRHCTFLYNSRIGTCIRFREKVENEDYIYILKLKGSNCFSKIGRFGKYVPVSLGPGYEELIPAVHEIMHSLGVYHTQSR
ncbi:meprin A subunit alpha-like protein [Leptotrombidium deliense]|uniref:Meprin A subunit alpha-like protein n=1 Tax=Leptotrombidium deliense TaxID=299467 RepID=A0A443S2K1_9ACAR|nr:meprin A subunit alpha-like protein [Leptotrombidium deliense]